MAIARDFNVTKGHERNSSLMHTGLKLEEVKIGNYTKIYQRLWGRLMYIMLCSRPDICFSITYFGQFQKCVDTEHYSHLLHVLEYLFHTKDLKLKFNLNDNTILEGYADVDFGGTVRSKSISGFCVKSLGYLIVWKSKKQNVLALSTTEVEILSFVPPFTKLYIKSKF